MDTALTVDTGASIGTAETQTVEQPTTTESAASGTKQAEGGEGQPSAEGGQQEVSQGRKRWSIQDEVKELRAQRRELRERLASLDPTPMRDELAQLREELSRLKNPNVAKTPANFFADPEARLQALKDEIQEVVANQNASLMDAFHRTREEEYALQAKQQEAASAAEFIRSQQGYDPQDDEDLIEIIGELPKNTRDNMAPQMLAEYAWLKLNQARGVGDRGLQKRQAAGVQGQPPGVGFGRKQWNRAEFDQAVDLVEAKMRENPNDPKMTELFNELLAANKEGRVK
jgi:hypothetical protein